MMKDTLGRENRKLADARCAECGSIFRKRKASHRYCSVPCARKKNGGWNRKDGPVWWLDNRGYIVGRIWINGKRVFARKARWIMEQCLGRPLPKTLVVHHINGNKTDNRLENLEIKEFGKHSRDHNKKRKYKRGYKLELSTEQRKARSDRAKAQKLSAIGCAVIAKAEGE